MKVTTKLIFRECRKYTNKEGKDKLRVRFLDEDDRVLNLFFDNDEKHKKYLDMKKDTICDIELAIYKSDKGEYALYSFNS